MKTEKRQAATKGESASQRLTPEQAKARLQQQGVTLTEFAKKHRLKYRTVSEVIRGVNKGLHGEGHRAAVALGIK